MSMGSEESAGGDGPSAPPGWYPVDGGAQRYWDGTRWTEHIAPGPASTEPASPGAAPPPGPSAASPYEPAPVPFQGGTAPVPAPVTADDRSMGLLLHLLTLVSGFLGPLIVWLIKRDQSPFIDYHGKEALNFQISLFLYWIIALLSLLVLIGLLLIPVLLVIQILFPILAAIAANRGEYYRYPLTIRIIS